MRTGIDILFDNKKEEGLIEAAAKLVESGMSTQEVSERLELSQEQIEQLEIRLGLKKESV